MEVYFGMNLKTKWISWICLLIFSNLLLILVYQGKVFNAGTLGCAGMYDKSEDVIYAGAGG